MTVIFQITNVLENLVSKLWSKPCWDRTLNYYYIRTIPSNTKTSQRRRKSVLIFVLKKSYVGLKWKLRWLFFKNSPRHLPGDVHKTSLRCLKTSSRLSVVKANTYYHPITRKTNCISLNKLNLLKHENNAEVMKNWFPIKC